MKNIAMIGCGKLGGPAAEFFEEHNYSVNKADIGDSIEEAVENADIVFIAVPTPHDPLYDGKYICSDLEPRDFKYDIVEDVIIQANEYMNKDQTLVLISTVLPGTCTKRLKPLATNTNFIYNPYLIAMGTVKKDMAAPEMIMIGGDSDKTEDLVNFYKTMCPYARYVQGTLEEIESVKIFYNTFITTKITMCNMIQDVAMKVGNMNVDVVTDALAKSSMRIMSPKYMKAGMGDGGSCHPRDNIALRWLAQEYDLGYDLFDSIIQAREMQAYNMARFLEKVANENDLPIVIMGKSFKPDLPYDDGSPSVLVSQYVECTFDDTTKPAVYLLAHSRQTTFGKDNEEYDFPEGSVVVDPWREREGAIHYGNTRL
jgi:UDPglucose 6-dehydrogenase